MLSCKTSEKQNKLHNRIQNRLNLVPADKLHMPQTKPAMC